MALTATLDLEERLDFLKVIGQLMHDPSDRTYARRLRALVSDASSMLEQFMEENRSEDYMHRDHASSDDPTARDARSVDDEIIT